jgi:hypothetical protein
MFKRFIPVLISLAAACSARAELNFVAGITLPGGGEVISHYNNPAGPDYVLVTNSLPRTGAVSHKVDVLSFGANGALAVVASANFDPIFGATATLSVSSVAADPAGRGFGVAAVIPADNTRVIGKVAFFELTTGNVVRVVDVGYHPDAVKFTPDGSKVIVANEGEFSATGAQAPGSVSIVNLAGVTGAASLTAAAPAVTTIDFNTGLAAGVNLNSVRINVTGVSAADRYLYIEPEFSAPTNDKVFVTLQENNAIATIDLTGPNANKITAVNYLGTILQRIDSSDQDPANGGVAAINIDDVVPGLPMPDTMVTFVQGGRRLMATANEGDARPDDGDIARAGAAGVVDVVSDGAGDAIFAGSLSNSTGLGRLNISRVDGNTDADPLIEVPTMIGTRSFTIWDEAGTRVFDSGSMIEEFVRTNAPLTFNMNNGTTTAIDTRSDDKGPEPEAIAYGEIGGRQYIFLGAERQNGIFQFDVTDLTRVQIVGYFNIVNGTTVTTGTQFVSPETLIFVPANESPLGRPTLLVGYEGIEGGTPGSVAVLEVTPSAAAIGNASIRTNAAANQTLFVGFHVSGASNVLMRAVGPALGSFGVTGFLEDPRLALFSGANQLDSNEDWGGAAALSSVFSAAGAFPLPPAGRDAAIARAITGPHTLQIAARTSGDTLVELYALGAGARFGNLSARARVGGAGDQLIGGFVVTGSGTKNVLVRAVGPRLTALGVAGALTDPRLAVYRGAILVGENDDWAQGATAADFAAAGAFPLDGDAKSSALRLTLLAGGAYTVHVTGVGAAAGDVLLEVYELP